MKLFALTLIFFLVSCSTNVNKAPDVTYVKIGASDTYSLMSTLDPNSVYKANNFDPDVDKIKLLKVIVGGIDTFRYLPNNFEPQELSSLNLTKVDKDDEEFNGLLKACSERASFEKVDTWALQTGLIATSATIGAAGAVAGASTAASAAAASAVAGPLILVMTAVGGAGAYIQNERQETIKRGVAMYGCLAENGYQAEPLRIGSVNSYQNVNTYDQNLYDEKLNNTYTDQSIETTAANLDINSFIANANNECKNLLSRNQNIRNDEITIEFKIYLDEMNRPTKIELSENNSDLNYTEKKLSKLAFDALENSKFISTSKLNETSIYFKKIKFPENFCTW